MIKLLRIILLFLIGTSCNSNAKTTTDILQNQKASQLEDSIKRGETVYSDMCITCHMANGEGVLRAFPPLAASDYLRDNQTKSIKGVKKGMSGEIVVNGITYNGVMAPLGLSDDEVADVMNYINNSWKNDINNFVTPEKVSKL